jgi:FixJ family two-component response regulator
MTDEATVFVVDDDASVLRSVVRLLETAGLRVEGFGSAESFLEREPATGPACLVLDVRMSGMTGLELQRRLTAAGRAAAVVFITGHGDVPMSVEAMKAGAVDFLLKPFDDEALLAAIDRAIARDRDRLGERQERERLQGRYERLTPRQRQVFAWVATGLLNKQVAAELGTSEKTIKVHRGRVMRTMQAGSLADLVRQAERLRLKAPGRDPALS